MSTEYHKIETVFERELSGTRKLVENSFRSPAVEMLKNNNWIFTEKIDGTNVRIIWDGHQICFMGRTNKSKLPNKLLIRLEQLFLVEEMEQIFEQVFGDKEVVLYGEGFGSGIQTGVAYSDTQDFVLFDVLVAGVYADRGFVETVALAFGIKVVPIVLKGTIKEAVDLIKSKPQSVLSVSPYEMEGLIGTPEVPLYEQRGERIIIKIKVKDFL